MGNFFFDQFSKMLTAETLTLWIFTVGCFLLDIFLIKKGPFSYLEHSIAIGSVSQKYKVLDLAKLKSIPEFQQKLSTENRLFYILDLSLTLTHTQSLDLK